MIHVGNDWSLAELSMSGLPSLIRGYKFKIIQVNSGFLKLTNSSHSTRRHAGLAWRFPCSAYYKLNAVYFKIQLIFNLILLFFKSIMSGFLVT